jgi:hypothetical protein
MMATTWMRPSNPSTSGSVHNFISQGGGWYLAGCGVAGDIVKNLVARRGSKQGFLLCEQQGGSRGDPVVT